MAAVIDRPSLWQRTKPVFTGFDPWLLLAIFLLAGIGLVTMYSVGFDHGTRFAAHARNMMLAFGVMFLVSQVPPQRLMMLALPLYVAGVVLLFGVEFFGIVKKGAQRWLNVGIVIQPSEIMKIAMPLMLAWWFQRREGTLKAADFLVAGIILAVPAALILKQPDLGTTLLVVASGLFVIFFAGLSWALIIPPVLVAAVAIVVLIVMEPQWCAPDVDWKILHEYQRQRVCTLLDPFKDPLGKGFHIIQGMIAIGSGGLWGKGFMQGTQTHLEFIPERTTDFIYAAFSEEFGLVGVACLLLAFLFFIGRGLVIALDAPTVFSRLLAGALTLNVFVYAFVNMGMVSGILPVVGVPLPFVSYGGTAMVTMGIGLGMLMSIAKSKRLMQS
ncbi:MAG: rod shape-determining protein RodA [Hydrogenophaga sp.]|jgi:rod shape determining protein RodA|uniref:rod shape-determining protein RodA n=1 Tax=Hydrogenophaga sp. TaxID=1904254 RepID=UPI0026100FD6|nr:rod shape-determining protein RodA [Hydrogenophaga sp.]MDD3786710.1 rod shape-determining protein RodA [Hydrogenophaga sp.]MDX9967676.1 rod shape-determining protein RodA [Hydrogenophaga sp.]